MRPSKLLPLFLMIAATPVATASATNEIPAARTRTELTRVREERAISTFLTRVADRAVAKFGAAGLEADNLGITLILDKETGPRSGSYRGDKRFYPASVIKLGYAVALEHAFATGQLVRDEKTLRDLDYMITDSSNAATNRILDRLTGTQSGPELDEAALREFADKRNSVNSYLKELGFRDLNANQKTWDDEPYGRDVQFLGKDYSNRNRMTTDETARLVWLIKNEKVVSAQACEEILRYMWRRPGSKKDIQARRIGAGIPPRSQMWSKAGWTNTSNHDAAYIVLPSNEKLVLVVFTSTSYQHPEIIGWIAEQVISSLRLGTFDPEWIGPRVGGQRPPGASGSR